MLAVLECRDSDDDVCSRALELVRERGGYLTLVAIAPKPLPWLNAGPLCTPTVTPEELRAQAEVALARAVGVVPADVAVVACVDEGRLRDVIRRRVEKCEPDVVVRRCSRLRSRNAPPPVPSIA